MFPLVEYLMDPDRNIDIEPRNDNEETPLHYAALQGQLEVVKYLIFKVKNKKPMDKFGKTPLDRAQSNGHQDIVDFLLNPQGPIHILRRIFFTPPPSHSRLVSIYHLGIYFLAIGIGFYLRKLAI